MPIEIIGGNCPEQNAYVADLYEKQHDKSLATALERSPKKKLVAMLQGMLLSRRELHLLSADRPSTLTIALTLTGRRSSRTACMRP